MHPPTQLSAQGLQTGGDVFVRPYPVLQPSQEPAPLTLHPIAQLSVQFPQTLMPFTTAGPVPSLQSPVQLPVAVSHGLLQLGSQAIAATGLGKTAARTQIAATIYKTKDKFVDDNFFILVDVKFDA